MKKNLLLTVLIPMILSAGGPTITFDETTITTTTGTSENTGSGNVADLGTETTETTDKDVGDWYIGTPQDDTIIYTPNTTDENDIFGKDGDDVIKPTDKEIEDYKGEYEGNAGNDYIELAWGYYNRAWGGSGDDTIVGYRGTHETSRTYIYGDDGDDKIYVPMNISDNNGRIYGGNGFDVMIIFGTSSEFTITKSWGRYYMKKNSTGKKFRFQDIEKIIFSTDPTPNIAGAEEGETFYYDESDPKNLSTTPTDSSNSELTTITLYEHRFSFYTDFISATGNSNISIYVDKVSDKIFKLKDATTSVEYDIYSKDLRDNDENVIGQVGWTKIPISTDGTRELILVGEEEATLTELNEIRATIVIKTGL